MRLKDQRGREIFLQEKTLAQLAEPRKKEPKGRSSYSWEHIEKLSVKTLKSLYLCGGAPCEGCEVMCGYGRRYLELTGGNKP